MLQDCKHSSKPQLATAVLLRRGLLGVSPAAAAAAAACCARRGLGRGLAPAPNTPITRRHRSAATAKKIVLWAQRAVYAGERALPANGLCNAFITQRHAAKDIGSWTDTGFCLSWRLKRYMQTCHGDNTFAAHLSLVRHVSSLAHWHLYPDWGTAWRICMFFWALLQSEQLFDVWHPAGNPASEGSRISLRKARRVFFFRKEIML